MGKKIVEDYFDSIDRAGIGIVTKAPFKNWLQETFGDGADRYMADYNVYLVGGDLLQDDVDNWLSTKYDEIFQNELNEWVRDVSKWPQNRTPEMFRAWFDVIYFGLVYDTEKGEVEKY